jgi:hypothetical protein
VLSNVLSPAISEVEDAEDQASLKTSDTLEVIELGSDEELEDLEKELDLSKFSYFVTSILTIHSGSQGNLEVPDILVLPI